MEEGKQEQRMNRAELRGGVNGERRVQRGREENIRDKNRRGREEDSRVREIRKIKRKWQ